MIFKEGEVVLCTVKSIVGTTVFVTMGGEGEGSIVMSEIAPGRIRNLREYVVPGKKIVCKILEINDKGNIHLSLRRVAEKERKELLEKGEKEKTALSIIRTIAKEKALEIAEEIKKESSLQDFLQNCRTSPEKLSKFFTKEEAERLCKILQEKKETQVTVSQEFLLSCKEQDGLTRIRSILGKHDITYLAAGHYGIKIIASDYKKANLEMQKILEEIETLAKKNKAEFQLK
ncbi:MAG: S1 RNA-binding domain-containing protein [Candidatus Pacearchaeota archaeon]|nr:S1 RNA-binding domain-containing protein [Candidatus Pacearchaeota archaeon]